MRIEEPDYIELWRHLVLTRKGQVRQGQSLFNGREKAEAYDAGTRRKNRERADTLVKFVVNDLKPGDTAIDIGAGTGRWTVPLAEVASKVTAIEPAGAMMDILKRNAGEAGVVDKVNLVSSTWEEADVAVHDVVTCAHAMYMSPDFVNFVRSMESHARRSCYMGIRHFPINGIIQELHREIYGYPHDGPNFIIAYNALYQMGVYGNVLMEELQHRWSDTTLESAFKRAKRHLHLQEPSEHDELIRETLERRLKFKNGLYSWPDGMNSALIWWKVNAGKN